MLPYGPVKRQPTHAVWSYEPVKLNYSSAAPNWR